MLFLTTQPLWVSALLLVGATTALAMLGPVSVRRRVDPARWRSNNEVAGFKFATVGVIYAVMLAFSVIVVWERFNDAETGVAQEAGAASTVFRLADGMDPAPRAAVHASVLHYLEAVVDREWPAMEQAQSSMDARHALDGVYASILTYAPTDGRGTALLTEALRQTDQLTQARRARLVMATGTVPGIVWFALFFGAILTVAFTLFFSTENLRAQTLMTGALTALIFSGLLVIVAIDHPFAGTVKVEPEALLSVLESFKEEPPR